MLAEEMAKRRKVLSSDVVVLARQESRVYGLNRYLSRGSAIPAEGNTCQILAEQQREDRDLHSLSPHQTAGSSSSILSPMRETQGRLLASTEAS